MTAHNFYNNFLEALAERFPKKSDLVGALMDVLPLERESIYRRLRRDVFFTSEEIMQIANAWKMSVDNIVCTNPDKTRPFMYNMIEYIDPEEDDYRLLEEYNQILRMIGDDPDGQMIEVINSLPKAVYCRFENVSRFFAMKWLYKYGTPENMKPFGDIHMPERMRALETEYSELTHNISRVSCICDCRFIRRLADDVNYFRSIRMISDDELAALKDELLKLVDYMEAVITNGCFLDTGNSLLFYVSHAWLEIEYILYESRDLTLSMVKIIDHNSIASCDKKVFRQFMTMAQSTVRSSVLMSASNNLQRTEFFSRQREIIISLG